MSEKKKLDRGTKQLIAVVAFFVFLWGASWWSHKDERDAMQFQSAVEMIESDIESYINKDVLDAYIKENIDSIKEYYELYSIEEIRKQVEDELQPVLEEAYENGWQDCYDAYNINSIEH